MDVRKTRHLCRRSIHGAENRVNQMDGADYAHFFCFVFLLPDGFLSLDFTLVPSTVA